MRHVAAVAIALVLVAAAPHAAPPPAPKLVVMIVVDQMRADYIDTFQKDWTGGLRRLVREGAWFRQAAYPYLTTVTCAGHATVATGAFPHRHGVFQNSWWSRESSSQVTCTADASAKNVRVSGKASEYSDGAQLLRTQTLADEMRAQKASHVAALSLKARSALMLAGHGGDGVIWLNEALDGWVSLSALSRPVESSVKAFIAAHPIEADYGKTWTRTLADTRYLYPDDGLAENPLRGWTSTFPHPLTSASGHADAEYYSRWERSPFADDYTGQFAAALIDGMQLGRHETTDVLAVSFSSPDLVGHLFGPRSQEIQDVYARLDRTVGALLDHLDAAVGRGKYVVALTADHGVTPIAEQLVKEGRDAGRLDTRAISAAAEKAVTAAIGEAKGDEKYVARENANDVYFSRGVYDRLAAKPGALDAVMAAIAGVPGVQRVFQAGELRDAATAGDRLLRAAGLSYVPGRSGDLVVAPKPGWEFIGAGATHGSANPDDQDVPILLMGAGIRHGEYKQPATPADIAPTLASLAGILMPHAEGRVLREALK